MAKKPTYEELEQWVQDLEKAVSEHRQEKENLRKERDRYKKYIDIVGEMFIIIDAEQNVRMINKRGCEILGYEEHEIVGKNWFDHFIKTEIKDEIKRVFDQNITEKVKYKKYYENSIVRKDGEERILAWHNSIIKDESGRVIGTLSSGDDITESMWAMEALKKSEEKYRDLYDRAPDMHVSVDAKTAKIIDCNKTTANELGYTKDEIIGRIIFDMYTPDSAEYAKKNVFPVFAKTGTIKGTELQLQRKDGRAIDVSLNVSATHDKKGNILYSRSIWRDITKQKQAEKLAEKRTRDIKRTNKELQEKTLHLKEANTALKVLLKRREEDQTEVEEKILANVSELIIPAIDTLKGTKIDDRQATWIEILETNLRDIVSPFSQGLSSKHWRLTPMEFQVANFIRRGKTTKEIAGLLHVATSTINTYRDNIRKKLGIKNRKINLKTYLSDLA